ncbi:MAG: TolC family protein [Nitrospirota bacterium]|nr:TolC family protein [Nitrospirota bacterium]
MAQTEKYMLLEREEMFRQKQRSVAAMLNSTVGRDSGASLGRPAETGAARFGLTSDAIVSAAIDASPEISVKKSMIGAAEAKVRMAEKEYYPDMTLNASYFARGKQFDDMWSLTTTINIPLYYRTKQRQAVHEAKAMLTEARNDLEAAKLMIASAIRDNMSMVTASERLMDLYKNGLIPKTYQDFESALAGYTTGRIEAITVITRLKNIIEFELLYWTQFTEREKAIARMEAISGLNLQAARGKDQ